jgi:acetyl-CoA synthetase (ADP-forming)
MAPAGLDIVVGCVLDDVFGPTVMFGLGGIHVELFKDVAFRIAPITVEQALEMMQEIRASKLMDGFRGSSPFDHQPVARILSRLSHFAFENRETIREIEINPVRVHSGGAVALDALVTMR